MISRYLGPLSVRMFSTKCRYSYCFLEPLLHLKKSLAIPSLQWIWLVSLSLSRPKQCPLSIMRCKITFPAQNPQCAAICDLPPEHVPHLKLEFRLFYVFQCSHASGAGVRYFNELCGLNVLYSSRHSSINTWASFKV
jgi:hypothetical protein